MMKTRVIKAKKAVRTGGDRLVYLTNGKGYIIQANFTFGIVMFGSKEAAMVMTLADAVGAIKDINAFGVHKLYAELTGAE